MYAQNNVKNIMNITSFNCNGLRSSISYVTELLKTSHIMFMCEHWLLPSELSFFRNTFQNLGKKVFLKSSIDPLVPLRGRPYGGIGFVCEIISGYTYMFEDYYSDRICALKVYQAEKLILTVYGLYMPYNNHCAQQLECYLEILDKLQST